jgi:exosortase
MNITGIKAVILAGSGEFCASSSAPRLSTALWPIAGRTVLERLLRHLADEGVNQAVICSNGCKDYIAQSINDTAGIDLKFVQDTFPLGTAGSIRDAVRGQCDEPMLVIQAAMVTPPPLAELWKEHTKAKATLTLALNPVSDHTAEGEMAGIYICDPSILAYIPEIGYCDIKETLVPNLIAEGKMVHAVRLAQPAGNFRQMHDFLNSVAGGLGRSNGSESGISALVKKQRENVYIHPEARVDPKARIIGPAIIMEHVSVAPDAVIVGPCIAEAHSEIGFGSLVSQSVLWSGARIGENCEVQNSLLDHQARVRGGQVAQTKYIRPQRFCFYQSSLGKLYRILQHKLEPSCAKIRRTGQKIIQTIVPSNAVRRLVIPAMKIIILFVAMIWSYRATLSDLWHTWSQNDEYSCGLLVPFLAVYLVWAKRAEWKHLKFNPSWWGVVIFLGAQIFRYFGLFFTYESAEQLSLIFSIAGLVLFVLGWQFFRKWSPILLFLVLMLPLPKRIENKITLPLQSGATSSAVFCLELLGYDVKQQENIIHIQDTTVAIDEACNGLRMATAFFVISGLVVLLIKRTWWEKLILLLSTLPIALVCNTIRLTITAIAFTYLEGDFWEKMFHDFGGYAMMPLALGIVVFELWLLIKLTTPPEEIKEREIREY